MILTAPTLPIVGGVILIPVFHALYYALHQVNLRTLTSGSLLFVGLDNFRLLFTDTVFWQSLLQTGVFTVASVGLELILGLGIALLIHGSRGSALGRLNEALILVPWAVPPVANALLWRFILHPTYGYANRLLFQLGLTDSYISFLGTSVLAMTSVVIAYVWRTTPFAILLCYAGLQGIPTETVEAARVDGASDTQIVRHIYLPSLRPVLAALLVIRTTFAMLVFDEIFAMTDGGPGRATWTAGWYTYQATFKPPFDIGLGSAAAVFLAVIAGCLAVAYVRLLRER